MVLLKLPSQMFTECQVELRRLWPAEFDAPTHVSQPSEFDAPTQVSQPSAKGEQSQGALRIMSGGGESQGTKVEVQQP